MCLWEKGHGPFYSVQREGTKASPSDVGFPLSKFYEKNFTSIIFETLGAYVGSRVCMHRLRMHT